MYSDIKSVELAKLSKSVYESAGAPAGWAREEKSFKHGATGFYGGVYRREKDGLRCLALRGSDELWNDFFLTNVQMLPAPDRVKITDFMISGNNVVARSAKPMLKSLARLIAVKFLNRMPRSQSAQALELYQENKENSSAEQIKIITGHSLGGALAVYVGQQSNTLSVSFNAPMVGLLSDVVPATSSRIFHINAVGDPVSATTAGMGSLPIGALVEVHVLPHKCPSTSIALRLIRNNSDRVSTIIKESRALRYYSEQLYHRHKIDSLIQVGAGKMTINVNSGKANIPRGSTMPSLLCPG